MKKHYINCKWYMRRTIITMVLRKDGGDHYE